MDNKIRDHYLQLLETHGDSPEAVQWSNRESQFLRFASLCRIGELEGKRIVDYGCGTAAFALYLSSINKTPSSYHGVDIVPEYFEYARKNAPYGTFGTPEMLGGKRFDYAIVSGVFNNNRPDGRDFWQRTVIELFARCDIGVAFNLMSVYVDYRDPDLFYEDPGHALNFIKREVTPYVTICHDYVVKPVSVPFEFTIFLYKKPSALHV